MKTSLNYFRTKYEAQFKGGKTYYRHQHRSKVCSTYIALHITQSLKQVHKKLRSTWIVQDAEDSKRMSLFLTSSALNQKVKHCMSA